MSDFTPDTESRQAGRDAFPARRNSAQVIQEKITHGAGQIRDALRSYPRDFWFCCALLLLTELGCALLGVTSIQVLENAVCHEFLEDRDGSDGECKQADIQAKLGFLYTALSTASVVAATVMQLPMGYVADKSRRLALVLNIVSTVLYWGTVGVVGTLPGIFPTGAFFAAPAFVLLGGGPWVTGALVFAAISDITPVEKRTTAFSIVEATAGISDICGPILGLFLMEPNIWIPYVVATACFLLMLVPASLIREKSRHDGRGRSSSLQSPEPSEADSLLSGETRLDRDAGTSPRAPRRLCSRHAAISVCFLAFLVLYLARTCFSYLIPWFSVRFHASIGASGLLFSLRALISEILYFLILPFASAWMLRKCDARAPLKDLRLSVMSVATAAVGAFVASVAPDRVLFIVGFALMILGSGIVVTLRSYIASTTSHLFSGRLFTAISMTETVGGLIGMPIMGSSYAWSVEKDPPSVCLLLVVASMCYLITGSLLTVLKHHSS